MRELSVIMTATVTNHAQPNTRNLSPSLSKKRYHKPANQIGKLNDSIARVSWTRNAIGERATSLPLRRIFACSSRKGKWFWIFHSRLGRKIRSAIAPPVQNQGER